MSAFCDHLACEQGLWSRMWQRESGKKGKRRERRAESSGKLLH